MGTVERRAETLPDLQGPDRVLLIGEPWMASAAEILTAGGYALYEQHDPFAALSEVSTHRHEAVLVDVDRRGLAGWPLVATLKDAEAVAGTAVIALTRRVHIAELRLHAVGGDAYLAKPVVAGDLLQCVRAHISRYRPRREQHARRHRCELTGLRNRLGALDILERHATRARRARRPLSMLRVSVDNYEQVRGAHGERIAGGAVRMVASLLRGVVRGPELAGRMDANKFLVTLPDQNDHAVERIESRVRTALPRMLEISGIPSPVLISIDKRQAYPG